jgi:glucose-6-phosphate isomerase
MKQNDNTFDWQTGFTIYFDRCTGLSQAAQPTLRHLSDMKGMYANQESFREMTTVDDPVIYAFYELGSPENPGDVAFGTSITYPGKVGAEYFFTKGHFHSVLETGEVYYCLSGQGFMLIENHEGDCRALPLTAGQAVYVPRRYAHRSINTGAKPLVTFFAFRGDAGHNYGSIEQSGFRKIIVEQDNCPTVVDNPRWNNR